MTACGAVLVGLSLVVLAQAASGQEAKRSSESDAPRSRRATRADAADRQRFLEMFARAYFPGRTGQLLIVPREGDFITRPDPDYAYMHGSPWPYDVSIPLMFVGPAVKNGSVLGAGRAAGRGTDAGGGTGRVDAPDRDGPRTAGFSQGLCATSGCHADRPRWHAPGLLRSIQAAHANARCPAPARRLVQSSADQLYPDQHGGWALDHLHRNRPPRARNHGCRVCTIACTASATTRLRERRRKI